jgi:hypothetical protein
MCVYNACIFCGPDYFTQYPQLCCSSYADSDLDAAEELDSDNEEFDITSVNMDSQAALGEWIGQLNCLTQVRRWRRTHMIVHTCVSPSLLMINNSDDNMATQETHIKASNRRAGVCGRAHL